MRTRTCPAHRGFLDDHAGRFRRVTDPDQVREVLRRIDDFAPHNALTSAVPLELATLRRLARARFALPPVLASATGDSHRRVRSVAAGFFTPKRVATTRERIAALTRTRADSVRGELAAGPVDLADRITRHVAPVVLSDLIGIDLPATDGSDRLRRWSRDSLELFWGFPDPARQLVLADSAAEFFTWIRDSLPATGSDLFNAVRRTGVNERQVLSLAYFLIIAGQETTAMLTDIALHRALRTPGSWHQVADERAAGRLVRRVLATESSVPTWRRVAVRDTELAGAPVTAGTELLLELTGHADAPALAFGHGAHRCLGAGLAELEATTTLTGIAATLPRLTGGGEPGWLRLLSFQAPATVWAARA